MQKLTYSSYEPIVIDVDSTDSSPEVVEKDFPFVRLIRKRRIGIGETFNCGLLQTRREFIDFDLNSDIVVDVKGLDPVVNVLSNSEKRAHAFGFGCGRRNSNEYDGQ